MKNEKLKKLIIKIINEQRKETKKSKPTDPKKVLGKGTVFNNKKAFASGMYRKAPDVTWRITPSGVDYESPGAGTSVNNYEFVECGKVKPTTDKFGSEISPIDENKK